MHIKLVPIGEGEPVQFDKAILVFGRHPDCDVVLTRSRKVSRKHCILAQINDYMVVRDLGSMNGILVNGLLVEGEARLAIGDELTVGDVPFRVEVGKLDKKPQPVAAAAGVRRVPSAMVSQDIPVAVPEDESDLIIDATFRGRRPAAAQRGSPTPKKPKPPSRPTKDEVIELSDDDIIG